VAQIELPSVTIKYLHNPHQHQQSEDSCEIGLAWMGTLVAG